MSTLNIDLEFEFLKPCLRIISGNNFFFFNVSKALTYLKHPIF